jgi:hypothetical protein
MMFIAASCFLATLASNANAQNRVPFFLDGQATWDDLGNAFNSIGAGFNDATGQATHLGSFGGSAQLFALAAPDDNGAFPVIGFVTLVAANGDQLHAFFSGTLNVSGNGTADFVFTGGSGRFQNATGDGIIVAFFDLSNGLANVPMDVQWYGEIDY